MINPPTNISNIQPIQTGKNFDQETKLNDQCQPIINMPHSNLIQPHNITKLKLIMKDQIHLKTIQIKIAHQNVNGLNQHTQEIKCSITNNKLDIIPEDTCTNKSVFKIPKYNIYHTNHPNGTAHEGAAIIMHSSMKHEMQS